MPSIKDAVAKNSALKTVGQTSLAPPVEPTAPPLSLDLPIMLPQRGMFASDLVLHSDRSDSSREFRGAGVRSAVFLPPPQKQTPPTQAQVVSTLTVSEWNPRAFYAKGSLITHGGNTYIAKIASSANEPPTSPSGSVSNAAWQVMGASSNDSILGGTVFAPVAVSSTDSQGNVVLPLLVLRFSQGTGVQAPVATGNGVLLNPGNATDADLTNYAQLEITGNSGVNAASLFFVGPPGIQASYSSVVLKIRRSVPTNSLDQGGYSLYYNFGAATGILIESAGPGVTLALDTVSVSLPVNSALATLSVNALLSSHGASGGSVSITSSSRTTPTTITYDIPNYGTVTYTYETVAAFHAVGHGLTVGNQVHVTGVTPSTFNITGAIVLTTPDADNFTIGQAGVVGETGAGGSIGANVQATTGSAEVRINECWIEVTS